MITTTIDPEFLARIVEVIPAKQLVTVIAICSSSPYDDIIESRPKSERTAMQLAGFLAKQNVFQFVAVVPYVSER